MPTASPRAEPAQARHPAIRTLTLALISVAALVALCALLFELRWETSDDIAMAMVAHGYGIAAQSSPHLFFSNVVWGHLVQLLDMPGLIAGYSFASLSVLTCAGAAVFTALALAGWPRSVCVAAVALVLARPLLFQQFTINAGLIAIAALLCWHHAARHLRPTAAYAGAGLLFVALIIRAPEACLVLLVALPLLPWAWLGTSRHGRLALLVLVLGFGAALMIDHMAYKTPAWQAFNSLNPMRAPFTDFGARRAARAHPQVVRAQGFSANDIELIGSWFFVDPELADPRRLRALLSGLGSAPLALHSWAQATRGIRNLWHPDLLPLFAAALLLTLTHGGWRVVASWVLCLSAVLALGIVGRPGALRVYVPLLCLLIVAPLLWSRLTERRAALALAVLVGAAAFNGYRLVSHSLAAQRDASVQRRALDELDQQAVVTWGSAFPFEAVFTVLNNDHAARNYRLYGLGVFTLAPFSVAAAEERAGRGFRARLGSDEGVRLIAEQRQLKLLSTYCAEHHGATLETLPTPPLGTLGVSRQRCRAAQPE